MFALGENIARIRTARRLTQDGLAQVSGVSVDTISRLERAVHTTARRSTLQALAIALCTDPGTLGAWSDYLAGRHTELLAGLPALMVDTRRAAVVLAGDHAAEAAGLLATS